MIPMLRAFPVAMVIFAIALVPAAFAGDSIDFSRPPAQGAKFKLTENAGFVINTTGEAAGQSFEAKSTVTGKEVYSHKIVEVKENRITLVERQYEDASTTQRTESAMFPEPQVQDEESPLSWKMLRARWNGDTMELTVQDGDDWKPAEEKIAGKLTSRSLRSPVLPVPEGTRSVGDTWELGSDEIKKYFPGEQFGGAAGSELKGEFKATLKSIQEVDGLECGIVEFELKITVDTAEGPSISFALKGTAHYSTQHCFFLKMKATGSLNSEWETEQQGMTISQKMKGDLTVETTAKPVTDE